MSAANAPLIVRPLPGHSLGAVEPWDMLQLEVGRLLELHETVTVERGHFERGAQQLAKGQELRVHRHHHEKLLQAVRDAERISGVAGLTSTHQAASRTRAFLEQVTWPAESEPEVIFSMSKEACSNVFHHLMDLTSRIRDDCAARLYYQVAPERAGLLSSTTPPFGQAVFDRFAMANEDIDEAGKCLALERGTATVFHLMRVLEAGLRALANELGIPYAPSWESYIKQINAKIDSKNWPNMTQEERAAVPFYREVLGDLTAVKIGWRNPTMHIVASYSPQQAAIIYDAAKAFMVHLAMGLRPQVAASSTEPSS